VATPTSSLGIILAREDPGAPGTFESIGQIGDFTGPDFGHDAVETTSHEANLNGRRRTFIASLGKATQLSFPLWFDSSDVIHGDDAATGIIGDGMSGTLRNFQMTLQDTGDFKISFAAFVAQAELNVPVEGVNTLNCSLQVSGNFTFDGF